MASEDVDGLTEVRIETISLGGVVEEANKVIAECISHCKRFPNMTKARKCKVEIHFKPEIHKATNEVGLNVEFFAVSETPKQWGNPDYAIIQEGKFVINASPHTANLDGNQLSFSEALAAKKGEG